MNLSVNLNVDAGAMSVAKTTTTATDMEAPSASIAVPAAATLSHEAPPPPPQLPLPPLRVLFITLEWLGPLFSGNGTYSRSLTRALLSSTPATTAAIRGSAGGGVANSSSDSRACRREERPIALTVLSARPDTTPMCAQDADVRAYCRAADSEASGAAAGAAVGAEAVGTPQAASTATVIDVPIPAASWGRLDYESPGWRAFADGVRARHVVDRVAAARPDVVLAVDWHGWAAFVALAEAAAEAAASPSCSSPPLASVPSVYLNFRVFSTSTPLHTTPAVAAFYCAAESEAVSAANVSVALCRQDAVDLAALALGVDPVSKATFRRPMPLSSTPPTDTSSINATDAASAATFPTNRIGASRPRPCCSSSALPQILVLLPPLREGIAALARRRGVIQDNGDCATTSKCNLPIAEATISSSRNLLVSCVRQSPEKGAHRFAELASALAPVLAAEKLRPFLCGSSPDAAYSAHLRATLVAGVGAANCDIESSFMDAPALADVFSRTVLNVHGALSDAYGMTLVEAAAFGAPSLVHVPLPDRVCAGAAAANSHSGVRVHFDSAYLVPGEKDATGFLEMRIACENTSEPVGRKFADDRLGMRLLQHRFPPVGACDLLAADASGPNIAELAAAATSGGTVSDNVAMLCADLTAPPAELAAQLAPLLAAPRNTLQAIGRAAAARALHWTEADSAVALREIIHRALERGSLTG